MSKTLTDKLAGALHKAASHLPAMHAHNTDEEYAQAMTLLAEYEATKPMDYTEHLKSLPLVQALWWFIENASEDDPHRNDYFSALRERMHEEATPRIVITIEGGLVQDVSANIEGIEFVKVDYDTEGSDEDDGVVQVAQLKPDGSITGHADAFISMGAAALDRELIAKRFEEAQQWEDRA